MTMRIVINVVTVLALTFSVTGIAIAIDVGKYKTHELVFTAARSPANPFDTYLLKVEVTDPIGKKFIIEGFYDGDGHGGQNGKIWKARITPYMTGMWSWRTAPGDAPDSRLEGLSGQFNCVESGDRGGVIAAGQHFKFEVGDFVYLQGNFLDGAVSGPGAFTHLHMSEVISDQVRDDQIVRHRDFWAANKATLYFANVGDYGGIPVTPWTSGWLRGRLRGWLNGRLSGWLSESDKELMDLARWKLYDDYIRRFKDNLMVAQMWFFADDSNFGSLSQATKNRLFRYAMARTSAFSNTMYVIALEYQEGWSSSSVATSGNFIQSKNPWGRMLSVHMTPKASWNFSTETWPTFIASQGGIDSSSAINAYAISMRSESIPHLGEEYFCCLSGDSHPVARAASWSNFAGGAAGGGTGSDLKAFMRFLAESKVPFQRMKPDNSLVSGGGTSRYVLAEANHHYVVYSESGAFDFNPSGTGLVGRWFNPRDPNANLSAPFSVTAGNQTFTPPNDISSDWVLFVSDGTNLNSGDLYPSPGAILTQEIITAIPDTIR